MEVDFVLRIKVGIRGDLAYMNVILSCITTEEKTLSITLWHTIDYRGVLMSEMWKSGQKGLNYDRWNPGSKLRLKSLKEDPSLRMDSSGQTVVSLNRRWESCLQVWRRQPHYGAFLDTWALEGSCWALKTRRSQRLSPPEPHQDPLSMCLWNHGCLSPYSLSLIFSAPLVEFSHKCHVRIMQVFTLCQQQY